MHKVSPGCAHCYAEARDKRFTGGLHWGAGAPRRLTSLANRNKPHRWNRAAAEALKDHSEECAKDISYGQHVKPPARPACFAARSPIGSTTRCPWNGSRNCSRSSTKRRTSIGYSSPSARKCGNSDVPRWRNPRFPIDCRESAQT